MSKEQLGDSIRELRFTRPELHLGAPDLYEDEVLRGRLENTDFYVSWHMGQIEQGPDFPVIRLAVAKRVNEEAELNIVNTFKGLIPELKMVSGISDEINGTKIDRYFLSTNQEGLTAMIEREMKM